MELKNKRPEVAVTTQGAIDNINQCYGTNDSQTNQDPKHISFFLLRAIDLITEGRLLEGGCKMKNTPCSDHDFCVRLELVLLTEKMKSDCYSEEKSSKEIMRDFFIGVKSLRDSQ